MQVAVQVFVSLVSLILRLLELLILARAVISWFPIDEDNPLINFLYFLTEPILAPIRALLERIPPLQALPIDLSCLIAIVILTLLSAFLPAVRF